MLYAWDDRLLVMERVKTRSSYAHLVCYPSRCRWKLSDVDVDVGEWVAYQDARDHHPFVVTGQACWESQVTLRRIPYGQDVAACVVDIRLAAACCGHQ